jgi:hypothetical protein
MGHLASGTYALLSCYFTRARIVGNLWCYPGSNTVMKATAPWAMALMDDVFMALTGVGAVDPSNILIASGNIPSGEELDYLSALGAAGDVWLLATRFAEDAFLFKPRPEQKIGAQDDEQEGAF